MGRILLAVALLGVGTGCGDKKDTTKPPNEGRPEKPKPGPGAFEKLDVRLGGERVPMERAIAKSYPDGRVQLYITPKKVVTCKELLVNVFDEKSIDSVLVDLVEHVGPDGKVTYGVGTLFMGTPTEIEKGGTAKLSGAPVKDQKIDVELDFAGTTGFEVKKLEVKGTLSVEGCGEQDVSTGPAMPKQPLPSTAVMTVAGKAYPVKGAVRRPEGIELNDFPRDCNAAWFAGMQVFKNKDGWVLSGKRIADKEIKQPLAGAAPAGSGSGSAATPMTLKIAAGKTAAGAGSGSDAALPTVELALSGEGKIGEYPVKLEGNVTAIDCK